MASTSQNTGQPLPDIIVYRHTLADGRQVYRQGYRCAEGDCPKVADRSDQRCSHHTTIWD